MVSGNEIGPGRIDPLPRVGIGLRIVSAIVLLLPGIGCSEQPSRPRMPAQDTAVLRTTEPPTPGWTGSWNRSAWQAGASITIDSVGGNRLRFSLSAESGGHSGTIADVAAVTGQTAIYRSADAYDTCLIRFELQGDTVILVTQESGNCGAAIGVTFSGTYRRSRSAGTGSDEPRSADEDLITLGIFEHETQDAAFRKLTGPAYSLFVECTQIIYDEDDLDSLHATVKTAGVRGLYTLMEHIVMIDAGNRIRAAVIDGDTLRYFTNDPAYARALPKTIEAWRAHFTDKPVVITYRP